MGAARESEEDVYRRVIESTFGGGANLITDCNLSRSLFLQQTYGPGYHAQPTECGKYAESASRNVPPQLSQRCDGESQH